MMQHRSLLGAAVRTLALATAGAVLAGCDLWPADQYPYTTTQPLTDFGMLSHVLYAQVTYIVLVIFVLVSILLAFVLVRFRDDGKGGNPEQIHGNTTMEIGWTLAPVGIVLLMIVPTIRTIFLQQDTPPVGATNEAGEVLRDEAGNILKPTVEIKVTGKRWWWAFEYVGTGVVTGNQFAIPDDRPVSLLIQSDTVIHSFWAPRIGGKRDAVPGRVNRIWFNLKKQVVEGRETGLDIQPGTIEHIRGECAEYCGEAHALMRFEIVALDGTDFDKWIAEYKAGPTVDAALVSAGEAAFSEAGCTGCHAITGFKSAIGVQGPNLSFLGDRRWLAAGVFDMFPNGRTDDAKAKELLHQWIVNPDSLKPGTTKVNNPSRALDGMNIPADRNGDGILQEEEFPAAKVDAIVAYLLAQKSSFPLE